MGTGLDVLEADVGGVLGEHVLVGLVGAQHLADELQVELLLVADERLLVERVVVGTDGGDHLLPVRASNSDYVAIRVLLQLTLRVKHLHIIDAATDDSNVGWFHIEVLHKPT